MLSAGGWRVGAACCCSRRATDARHALSGDDSCTECGQWLLDAGARTAVVLATGARRARVACEGACVRGQRCGVGSTFRSKLASVSSSATLGSGLKSVPRLVVGTESTSWGCIVGVPPPVRMHITAMNRFITTSTSILEATSLACSTLHADAQMRNAPATWSHNGVRCTVILSTFPVDSRLGDLFRLQPCHRTCRCHKVVLLLSSLLHYLQGQWNSHHGARWGQGMLADNEFADVTVLLCFCVLCMLCSPLCLLPILISTCILLT